MSAIQEKKTAKLDLAIRTLKPRNTSAETSEKQNARVVVVTSF